jgi:hypothetical protein
MDIASAYAVVRCVWLIDFCPGAHAQNIMTFNKCSINGRSYGDAYDEDGNPVDVTEVIIDQLA